MAFDHSHVITDLTIEEVTNLPTGLDIDDTKLYFRTNEQLYYRPLAPVSNEEPGQAAYLIPDFRTQYPRSPCYHRRVNRRTGKQQWR